MRLAAHHAKCTIVLAVFRRWGLLTRVRRLRGMADGNAADRTRSYSERGKRHRGDHEHLTPGCQPHHGKADDRFHRATAVIPLYQMGKPPSRRDQQADAIAWYVNSLRYRPCSRAPSQYPTGGIACSAG